MLVACGSSVANVIITSSNETTWTACSADTASIWNCLWWSSESGLLVSIATGEIIRNMSSSNARYLTVRNSSNGNAWNCVAWSSELAIFAAASSSNAFFKAM